MGNYTHLSSSDRRRFYTFLEMKLSIADIAKRLGKHRSTFYRELERNKELEGYLPGTAQLKANERAKEKRQSKIEKDGYLQDYVARSLKKGWSPEQISGLPKFLKKSLVLPLAWMSFLPVPA